MEESIKIIIGKMAGLSPMPLGEWQLRRLERGNLVFRTRDIPCFHRVKKNESTRAMTNGRVSSTIVVSLSSCENKRDK